jgi:hypothetical protein
MRIDEIDKNFKVVSTDENGFDWYDAKDLQLYGVNLTEDGFVRMPKDAAMRVNETVAFLATNTAGGRVRFSTNSKKIAIKAEYSFVAKFPHMPLTGTTGFSLVADYANAPSKTMYEFIPPIEIENEYTSSFTVNENLGDNEGFTLYFPLYSSVKSLHIGVEHGSAMGKGKAYEDILPVLFYGSSITQGGCASRPGNDYIGLLSKWMNIDILNLGFSGNAKGEDAMAEYLSSLSVSAFVYDYDHNAPSHEHYEKTHSRFFDIFRKAQPSTPVIFMTRPTFSLYTEEDANGRIAIAKKTYSDALERGDKNVYFIDGRSFMDCDDTSACSVDDCHPTDLGFYFMANKLEPVLRKILNK